MEKEWLIEKLNEYKNASNISKNTGVSKTTLYRNIKKYGLENLVDSKKNIVEEYQEYKDKEWLERMLEKYHSGKSIHENTNYSLTSINRWIRKHGLEEKRNVGKNIRKTKLNENFFETIDTEEKAYWLGFIIADGCIIESKKTYSMSVTLGIKDEEHLLKLKESLETDTEVRSGLSGKGTLHTTLCVHSKKMFKDLQKLNIVQRKTGKEKMPNIPEEFHKDLIRGFFDGDGSTMTKSKYVKIGFNLCCSSTEFLTDLRNIIEKNTGVRMNVLERENISVIQTTSVLKCKKIYEWIYEDSKIHLDRKNKTIEEFLFNSSLWL